MAVKPEPREPRRLGFGPPFIPSGSPLAPFEAFFLFANGGGRSSGLSKTRRARTWCSVLIRKSPGVVAHALVLVLPPAHRAPLPPAQAGSAALGRRAPRRGSVVGRDHPAPAGRRALVSFSAIDAFHGLYASAQKKKGKTKAPRAPAASRFPLRQQTADERRGPLVLHRVHGARPFRALFGPNPSGRGFPAIACRPRASSDAELPRWVILFPRRFRESLLRALILISASRG